MSDTRRHVDTNWKVGQPEFDAWNEKRRTLHISGVTPRPVESVKDQEKDRSGIGRQGGKFGRFIKGTKNSLWNLQRKNEQLAEDEELKHWLVTK
jgi:hypothetical protein